MEINHLSEYIVKDSGVLSKSVCDSLAKIVSKGNDFSQKLVESDINELSNIVSKYYKIYYDKYMPPIDLTESDVKTFNLELDVLSIKKSTDDLYNLGGKDKSHRFLAFAFIVSEGKSEIDFPSQKVINNCVLGDLYIFPSKFTHRFKVNISINDGFTAIIIYTCI